MQEKIFRVLINKLCKDVTGSPFHLKAHISWVRDTIVAKIFTDREYPTHNPKRLAFIEMKDNVFNFIDAKYHEGPQDYGVEMAVSLAIPMADPEFIDKLTAELQKRWDKHNNSNK